MAFVTQSDTVRNIGKLTEQFGSIFLEGFNDNGERRKVVGFNPEVHGLGSVVPPSALAASVIIPMQNSGSPYSILWSFAQRICQRRNSSLPTPMFCAEPQRFSSVRPFPFSRGFSPMTKIDVLWDRPFRKMAAGDVYRLAAATKADMFPGIGSNEFLFLLAPQSAPSRVISHVDSNNLVSKVKSAFVCSLCDVKHFTAKHREINGSVQVKSGELQETPLAKAKGNLQPSRRYTGGRFRDYRSGTARLMTGFSARLSNTRDEIVHASSNAWNAQYSNGLTTEAFIPRSAASRVRTWAFPTVQIPRVDIRPSSSESAGRKFSLIDLDAEMQTGRKLEVEIF